MKIQKPTRNAWLIVVMVLAIAPVVHAQEEQKSNSIDYRLQYAKAFLAYSKVNLERAENMNARVSGTVPAALVEEYRDDVEVAEKLLSVAQSGDATHTFSVFVRLAEASYNQATRDYERAKALRTRTRGSFSELDVERLRLRAELAKINLEEGRSLTDGPEERQSQWKMRLLYTEVMRLNGQIQRLTLGRGR